MVGGESGGEGGGGGGAVPEDVKAVLEQEVKLKTEEFETVGTMAAYSLISFCETKEIF